VIASDHGFAGTSEVFHINTWLEQAGYLTWTRAFELGGPVQGTLGMNALARHTYWLDWEKTTAYVATPTSNGIHILVAAEEGKPGVRPDDYLAFRDRLAEQLRAIRDPASGEAIVTGLWTREEIFAGPSEPLAPDLTLALRDGGLVSILPAPAPDGVRKPLRPRERVAGTHHPLGVLLASGPAIRPGVALPELSILDVAPLLLYSLGLPIPETIEGRVPLEIVDPAPRTRQPAQVGPVAGGGAVAEAPRATGPVYDEEAEAIILERLRALGYVE
jgi:predicted AlkP superfamily phosphohydrolase/phosphomutase